jgi:hypothetical protein
VSNNIHPAYPNMCFLQMRLCLVVETARRIIKSSTSGSGPLPQAWQEVKVTTDLVTTMIPETREREFHCLQVILEQVRHPLPDTNDQEK